ncbi:MAG: LysR substrate-binding protein [Betaproteobacteria bacterium]|jgi:phosphate transport system substrate-binding protein|nr:LysR substrate-binding protein [Betaproteobacteria bacterium]MEA3157762.1 phosphate transport system substrate-binding protein [Betaproteobacteria bacterium]
MTINARSRPVFILVLALLCLMISPVQAQGFSTVKTVQGKLVVTGSATLFPLMNDVARRFESKHPGIKIDVRSIGSGRGIVELRAGTADVGMLSRALFNNERDLFGFPIARDGLAVVVHRDNPIKGVNSRELSELLTGRIVNWKQLGGRDLPINLAWRTQGHGSVELILERLNLRRDQMRPHIVVNTGEEGIRVVAKDPKAVTLASVAEAERSAQAGIGIKLLAYNGSIASSRTIQNHNYMLSRPMTLVTRHLPQGVQKQFIDYALSSDVVDLQVKYGFVPYQE